MDEALTRVILLSQDQEDRHKTSLEAKQKQLEHAQSECTQSHMLNTDLRTSLYVLDMEKYELQEELNRTRAALRRSTRRLADSRATTRRNEVSHARRGRRTVLEIVVRPPRFHSSRRHSSR